MSIIIGGDFVPTTLNQQYFEEGKLGKIFDRKLLDILDNTDVKIFNLEAPLTNRIKKIKKAGPHLKISPGAAASYKKLGIDIFAAGNNHIRDYGEDGISDTLNILEECGIRVVGAGRTGQEAKEPCFFEDHGVTYGIYSCCEHEFSVSEKGGPGANLFDMMESFDDVCAMSKKCDYAIVLYHSGRELYPYPVPLQQKICRRFVQKGASLVICQHSHCLGCREKYLKGEIVYGQGDFLFDRGGSEVQRTGAAIRLNDGMETEYIPVCTQNGRVQALKGDPCNQVLRDFYKRSCHIKKESFVEQEYKCLCSQLEDRLICMLRGSSSENRLWKALHKISKGKWSSLSVKLFYNEKSLLSILNMFRCQTHHELFVQALENKIKEVSGQ